MAEEIIVRLKLEADVKKKMNDAAKDTAAGSKKIANSFDKAAASAKKMVGAYLGLQGLKAGFRAVSSAIDLADRQTRAEVNLARVIKTTGQSAGHSATQMLEMASSLQEVTRFGDEAIIEAQTLLATFTNIGETVFPKATETALDMSTVFGQDLKSSAVQLGKALDDPIKGVSALARVGVSFSQDQKDMIRSLVETGRQAEAQRLILKALETQVGGTARAAVDAAGGGLEQMKNVFGDMVENIGTAITKTELYQTAIDTLKTKFGELSEVFKDPITKVKAKELKEYRAEVKRYDAQIKELTSTMNFAKASLKEQGFAINNPVELQRDINVLRAEKRIVQSQIKELLGKGDKPKPRKKTQSAAAGFFIMSDKEMSEFQSQVETSSAAQRLIVEHQIQLEDERREAMIKSKQDEDAELKKISDDQRARDEFNAEMRKFENEQAVLLMANSATRLAAINKDSSEKQFKVWKATAMAQAGIALALELTKSLSNPFKAAAVAIAGGIQIGTIAGTPPPKFESGGIVPGNSPSGDRVHSMLNSEEMVLNKAQQAKLFAMANGAGGGGINIGGDKIIIQGNATQATVNALRETNQEKLFNLREMLIKLKAAGQSPL